MLRTQTPLATPPDPPREPGALRPSCASVQGRPTRFRGVALFILALATLATGYRALEQYNAPTGLSPEAKPSAPQKSGALADAEGRRDVSRLYGRITTYDGAHYEGPLRWGGDEEVFWDHYFNGYKATNPWASFAPLEALTEARSPVRVLGFEVLRGKRRVDLGRPFMVRFGDIARIDAVDDGLWAALERGVTFAPEVRVTLRNGTMHTLDRLEAGDFDDGVEVWDDARGRVYLGPRQIWSIEFLARAETDKGAPTPASAGTRAGRLYGTVYTRQGVFTGFLQWNRQSALGSDVLTVQTDDGLLSAPFGAIGTITRETRSRTRVSLLNGHEHILTTAQQPGPAPRGVYVDDPRYGRVLVAWEALERVEFAEGGQGPAYANFAPGRALSGRVTTRDGKVLAGRLVYDFDESETIETLDAPRDGVDYTLPFGLVETIALPPGGRPATVRLHNGEVLHLERTGDLGAAHAGVLVFTPGEIHPNYVPWADVAQIDFDGTGANRALPNKK